MKSLNLIPLINLCGIPTEVNEELNQNEIWTHDVDHVLSIDWDNDESDIPHFREWLVKSYGEMIKNYERFALSGC